MSSSRSRGARPLFVPALLILGVTILAAACGGGDEGEGGDTSADGGPATFDISLGDEPGEGGALVSFFIPDELTVAAGQEVTFNLSNVGTVPHNMRIAGPDGEYNSDDDVVVVNPQIVNPGDTAVLKWTAPSEAGTVAFRCDFHLNSGAINVE